MRQFSKKAWRRFVAFWVADDPYPQYSRLDELDGLGRAGTPVPQARPKSR